MLRPLFLLVCTVATVASAAAQRAPAAAPAFVENRGQWDTEARYLARLSGCDVWVTVDALVFDFYASPSLESGPSASPTDAGTVKRAGHVAVMRFEGGRAQRIAGHGLRGAYHNYFLGDEPARWTTRVPLYDEVVLESLYPGVDLRLSAGEEGLRYALTATAQADVSPVRFHLEGADGISVADDGALRVQTALGTVEHRGQTGIRGVFAVGADGAVAVTASGDGRGGGTEQLIWSTFLGGADGEEAAAVALSDDGEVTVVGRTNSIDFPTTPGAYDTVNNGGSYDAYVARLSADGTDLLYATYLGGGEADYAFGVAVAGDGEAIVTGNTRSPDFPTTPSAFDLSFNGPTDGFVARLSADGTDLRYGTYLGGTGGEVPFEVAMAPGGEAVVVGTTYSEDFPVTPGAFDTTLGGNQDAFVARLSADGSALSYATLLGGSDSEEAYGVAVSTDGQATVAGGTWSPDFPATPGAFDTSFNGGTRDGFLARFLSDGTALVYATFLGGTSKDFAIAVAVGADGSATVAGETWGGDFPTTPGAFDPSFNGSRDAFIAKLSADGATLRFGTYLGGVVHDEVGGLALDATERIVVVGATGDDFPTTPGAFDTSYNGSADAYVAQLSADGTDLLYGTYLGGEGSDQASGVALDEKGIVTVAGMTFGEDFPTTPGAYDTTYNGDGLYGDAFVARLGFGLLPFVLTVEAPVTTVPRGGQLPLRVTVANNTEVPIIGDLVLNVESQGGYTATRFLFRGATLPAHEARTPEFSLLVPQAIPVGLYTATVTALEGGTNPLGEASFVFRVVLPEGTGSEATSEPWSVAVLNDGGLVAEAVPVETSTPFEASAWPNPTSGEANVGFALAGSADVRLALYDVLGREVASVDAGRLAAGAHRLALDVSALPAGVYVWRLAMGERVEAGRLTVVR